MLKDHSPALAGLDVAQPQQGHKHQPGQHQAWQPGHMDTAVRLLPSQSKTLKVKKQDMGMKESPQMLVSAVLHLTSAIMAGNAPMVTMKMKQTEKAGTKIFLRMAQIEWLLVVG